jgi:DNA-binding NarL/FixJ family response regulator
LIICAARYRPALLDSCRRRCAALLRVLQLILSGERYILEAAVTEARVVARPTSRGNRGFPSLSHRERQVLRLLVEGVSNKQIGQGLEIEVVTVAVHLRSIYRKLNVKSRTRAVRRVLELGWTD